uniref:TATA box-binding protein-like 1 n=1 Tax=Anopheles epiroticus TaxID=199890 RepID=A0A182PG90_9DIPT
MHSTSQGGSMAATLLQQKTFMNGLAGGSAGGGPSDGPGASSTVASVGGTSVGSPNATTFLPVSKTLIHHLLPNHALQADHHHHHHHQQNHNHHHTASATLLHRGINHSTGAFVVVSSPTHGTGGGTNSHHRTEQYRTHRGMGPFSTLASSGCEDPPASALDDIFSPPPLRQLVDSNDATASTTSTTTTAAAASSVATSLETDCAVWDAIESAITATSTAGTTTTATTAPAAIGQCASLATSNTIPSPTNHASINSQQQHCIEQPVSTDCSVESAEHPEKQQQATVPTETGDEQEAEPEPEIDIVINNVVCSFSVRCHLNLHEIALNGDNVEFRRENGMVTMKLRRPYTTASIWSSGKITCTGATSEDQAKVAARRYSRCLQKLGFNVRLRNFRIVNVLGTCAMPWGIKIVNFSEKYKKDASYEPELHPGVTYKLHSPRATLKIFSTGSITVTAASVAYVQAAIEHIFPLVYEFRKKRTPQEKLALLKQPPGFDPQELDLQEDGNVDLLAAAAAASDGSLQQGEMEVLDDDDNVDALVSEDYEMHEEHEPPQRRSPAPSPAGSGNTKAIDKSNSIRT